MNYKLYLENPYLREINARIIDKKYNKGIYYLKLDRTIFYPHLSGGQPRDKGTINGIEVKDVYEENGNIVHIIDENIHSDKVTLNIDWNTRVDNMQQHTGQHLLSATFYKLYNAETVGFHIGEDYVYIDVTLPEMSNEEAEKIEIYANKVITSSFGVKAYYIHEDDIDNIPLIKRPSVNSNIRIVEINGIDFSPCAGTHLRNTGEIGIIKIRKWEKYKGNIRVEFVCGSRALEDYRWKNNYINEIAVLLSSRDKDVLQKVKLLYNQNDALEKQIRDLREKKIQYEVSDIEKTLFDVNGISFISRIFQNRDLKELNKISSMLKTNNNLIQIYGLKTDDTGQFLIVASDDISINLKDILKDAEEAFELKGGGTRLSVQGKVSSDKLEDFIKFIFEKLKA